LSLETEHALKKVRTVQNVGERGKLVQEATRILTFSEREGMKREQADIKAILNPEHPALSAAIDAAGKQRLVSRVRHIEDSLEKNSPPSQLPGETKDALYSRKLELEKDIAENMPSHEVMRRNPAGAVDWHLKWEKENKARILEWKNIQRTLNPDDDSKDLANVEMLRPSMMQRGPQSSFMADAQISGHVSYNHIEDKLWSDTFGNLHNVNSPYERKVREEQAAMLQVPTEEMMSNAIGLNNLEQAKELERFKAENEKLKKTLASREEKKAMEKQARSIQKKKWWDARRAAQKAARDQQPASE
jgi:hypothetical protein